ncbi:hypothetical protein B566_EDAN014031 [Ephemera danica]|nr:hypothetical protein B566_EDAN014031 [Ephemera danica]
MRNDYCACLVAHFKLTLETGNTMRTRTSLHNKDILNLENMCLNTDPVSRLHYYLQLRHNLLQSERACPHEERLLRMLGCALQADLGDRKHDEDENESAQQRYFEPREYVPEHAVERVERLARCVVEQHRSLRGVSTGEAQRRFIADAATSPLNLQLHRLQRAKRESAPSAWLGVCARGIDIFEEEVDSGDKHVTASFQWAHISNLCFERKKFEVRAVQDSETVRRSFYTGSAERSRQLLLLCRAAHQFSMALGPRLVQLRREHEEAERKRLRDCSLVPRRIQASLIPGSKRSEQRESVISSASSNTTSGIVSDRVLSFDESEGDEDDLEIEIMINSPPAPVIISSVESLALAHLQDQEQPTEDEEEEEQEEAPVLLRHPPVTEGSSQCSSSGSTVKHAKEASGSSSLELGFSHTAQNSCSELDYSVTSAQASAGAYPSRAPSVSLTLDSNSDYVQLPPLELEHQATEARIVTTRPTCMLPSPSFATSPVPPPVRLEPRVMVTRNNYLDVRASGAMATVYTRQLSQSQIEQFKRQLCSDVDYVIFPVRDPAVSRQEYADHKLLTRLLPPPPYISAKGSMLYRSAPNVAVPPAAATARGPILSPCSSNLAALRSCMSTHSLAFDSPPSRATSDDNLLMPPTLPPPRPPPRPPPLASRLPPPTRPPPRFPKKLPLSPMSSPCSSPVTTPPSLAVPTSCDSISAATAAAAAAGVLDIRTLREKSRHLDLPLIAALCNDRSLLRQTRGETSAAARRRHKLYPRSSSVSGARHTAHKHPKPHVTAAPTTSVGTTGKLNPSPRTKEVSAS